MPVNKLTHEEADRRLLEAMKPKKQASAELLNKLRQMAQSRKTGTSKEQRV